MKYDELGKFIKIKRELTGFSLNKFAVETDVDPAILCRIENLKQGVKINILQKIARGFNKTPAQFLAEFEQYNP